MCSPWTKEQTYGQSFYDSKTPLQFLGRVWTTHLFALSKVRKLWFLSYKTVNVLGTQNQKSPSDLCRVIWQVFLDLKPRSHNIWPLLSLRRPVFSPMCARTPRHDEKKTLWVSLPYNCENFSSKSVAKCDQYNSLIDLDFWGNFGKWKGFTARHNPNYHELLCVTFTALFDIF